MVGCFVYFCNINIYHDMKIRQISTFIFLFLLCYSAKSQYILPFGFEKKYNIAVIDSNGNTFTNPWAGGLNACQFGEIDLDGDGTRDLVIFDRNGNRTLTYKNLGLPGEISYQFKPELTDKLPHFDDWVIFADYNMDGLNDIFAYSKGYAGVKVYKNMGTGANQFELVVFPYLRSDYGSGYVNILVTYADYPAIYDIDNDGDLDLLTFWGMGSFVEYHKNQSMEKYGNADSLDFKKVDNCWGSFAESEESNIIYLDTCFEMDNRFLVPPPPQGSRKLSGGGGLLSPGSNSKTHPALSKINQNHPPTEHGRPGDRHTGSTFMVFDENGDGLDDLLLGDVDYSSPALLINGGTGEDAFMISHTFTFPDYDVPIDLVSFPLMSFLDLNNDNIRDLIISTFDPSLVKSRNLDNIWFYENAGEEGQPVFQLQQKNLFQEEMLDFGAGSTPLFFDYNSDGLVDIVVSNFGYFDSSYHGPAYNLYCNYRSQLALLKNIGTPGNPSFKLIDRNYANLPSYFSQDEPLFAACPTFGDLDGDNDDDMLVGNSDGSLHAFENIAQPGNPAEFILVEYNYQNIDAGYYSAPQLFDMDEDGLQDLVIGKRNGTISYYRNSGTSADPVFTYITDSLGQVDVRNPNLSIFGYCAPHFFRDINSEIYLFAGSEFGDIFYYSGIKNNLDGEFKLIMKNYLWIDEGLRSAVAVGNLNNDGYPDMIVGNYSGGLSYFDGTTAPPAGFGDWGKTSEFYLYPNPATNFIVINSTDPEKYKHLSFSIFNITGRKVMEIDQLHQNKKIEISKLKKGIYFVKIDCLQDKSTGNFSTLKFIKL